MEIRPRTTGEILDDAWRLALADAPLLLLFGTLFLAPTFTVLLLLLAQPVPSGFAQCGLPALAALLLSLTGLASGACQELFRRRAAGEPVSARGCLAAALRHGLEHMAARAALLCIVLFGLFLLLMPGLVLWASSTSLHTLLAAGKGRSKGLLREIGREAAFAPAKAAAVTLSRIPLLLLVAAQLHLLSHAVLWIVDNLGGFDMALLSVELTFWRNPVYTTALFLLSWLLLTPFFEAGNFLLHTDIRTRQEGLDLQYRVQRVFADLARPNAEAHPAPTRRTIQRGARIGALLILGGVVLIGQPARADEGQWEVVRSVRQEVESIRAEVKKAEPYPGGQRWAGRLRALGTRLERAGGDARRFRWFGRAIEDFGARTREDALRVLDDLHRRLSLLEDSLTPRPEPAEGETGNQPRRSAEEVKALLRGSEGRQRNRARPREKTRVERQEPQRDEQQRDDAKTERPGAQGGGGGGGPGASGPAGGGGLSFLGWLLLGGLGLAVVVTAVVLYLTSPAKSRTPKPPAATGTEPVPADNEARQVLEESPSELWRQAEGLAGEGRFREAVRVLYLAVLALLHRQQFIRFEPTRTNGEYVRQVRLSERAPAELHGPFHELTDQFEAKWYGERGCESDDYRACRALAEEIQRLSTARYPLSAQGKSG